MTENRTLILRLVLLAISVAFVAGYAATQYSSVQSLVKFICTSCLGLNG